VNRKRNRRKVRNLIVNKKQLTIVIIGSIYLFLSIVLIFTITISPIYRDIFKSSEISDQRDSAKIFIILSEKLITALFAAFILAFLPLVWGTHRIFGPLINFANIFRKVTAGDLTARIYLRRGDLLKSEALLANEMIQSLSDTIGDIKNRQEFLARALKTLADGDRNQGGQNHEDLVDIRNQALACQKLLAEFKTADSPS
jgi:methyl-accepting chemotaxis protein